MDEKKKQEKISRMIVNYLRKNPDAGDTLEGITKWWLELERIEISTDEIADVLESLVEKGVIRMRKVKNGANFYRINDITELTEKKDKSARKITN